MRKLFFAFILLLALIFIFIKLAEVQTLLETMQRGDWRFILLAFGIQILWTLVVAAGYRAVYRAIDLEEDLSQLVLAVVGANSFNVIAPTGGVGGIAVFINQARRRGYSAARVTVA